MKKFLQWFCLLLCLSTLTGCFSWLHAYQTYLQMDDFEENFTFSVGNQFSLHFKDPLLYSEDLLALLKLQASEIWRYEPGQHWRYLFRKIDAQGRVIQPGVKFYFDLKFNEKEQLVRWDFSSLFLEIAPAEFLEVSLRSLAGAKIDQGKRQLKANLDFMGTISAELPKKPQILQQLGRPVSIKDKKGQEIYRYHFRLDTAKIEKGYEDRGLSVIKLSFDKTSRRLIKMSGRFMGLKISIDYRKYHKNSQQQLVQLVR